MRLLFTLSLLLLLTSMLKGQATYGSNGTGPWTSPGNWTLLDGTSDTDMDGLPDSDDSVVVRNSDIITVSTTETCEGLTVQGSSAFNVNGSGIVMTISGQVAITGGTLTMNSSSGNLNMGGLNISSGTYNHDEGTATISDSLSMSGGTYTLDQTSSSIFNTNKMTITGGTATLSSGNLFITRPLPTPPFTDAGTLEVRGGLFDLDGAFALTSFEVALSGGEIQVTSGTFNTETGADFNISGTGVFDQNGGSVTINSDVINSGGTFSTASTFTATNLNITGGTNETLTGALLTLNNDLDIAASSTFSIASTIEVVNATTVDGTLNISGNDGTKLFDDITIGATGNWNSTVSEVFVITGNITSNGIWTGCSDATCDYQLGDFTGTASYTISGSGSMTNMGTISLFNTDQTYTNTNTGGLEITAGIDGAGTFVNGANGRLEYQGADNFNIDGFDASAIGNTVVLEGTAAQGIRATDDSGNNYYNLIINNTTANITLFDEINIDGTLILTNGNIILDDFNLILSDGATISGASSSSYIVLGDVAILRRAFSSNDTFTFPIGTATDYLPLTLTMNSATYGSGSYVDIDLNLPGSGHPNRDDRNIDIGGDDTGTVSVDYLSSYYTLTANNISSPDFDVTYRYAQSQVLGTTEANMVAALYRTHPIHDVLDWFARGMVNASTNTVFFPSADAFGDLYAMDVTLERLPIKLLTFVADVSEKKVRLRWSTGEEEGNSFFTIERGSDPSHFETIEFIAGAGDSEEILHYEYLDESPLSGRYYYRLKQTDFSGDFTYSELVSAWIDPPVELEIYPNPVKSGETVKIRFPDSEKPEVFELALYNANGTLEDRKRVEINPGSISYFLINGDIQKGLHFLVFQTENQLIRKPLIVN